MGSAAILQPEVASEMGALITSCPVCNKDSKIDADSELAKVQIPYREVTDFIIWGDPRMVIVACQSIKHE